MFYRYGKSNKLVVSDSINSGYSYDPKRYDPEKVSAEAPTVYKLLGENRWILVYDIYGLKPNNFGFSETSTINGMDIRAEYSRVRNRVVKLLDKFGNKEAE